jgi:hypothetical protein
MNSADKKAYYIGGAVVLTAGRAISLFEYKLALL